MEAVVEALGLGDGGRAVDVQFVDAEAGDVDVGVADEIAGGGADAAAGVEATHAGLEAEVEGEVMFVRLEGGVDRLVRIGVRAEVEAGVPADFDVGGRQVVVAAVR